jgi:putative flippase GtrA
MSGYIGKLFKVLVILLSVALFSIGILCFFNWSIISLLCQIGIILLFLFNIYIIIVIYILQRKFFTKNDMPRHLGK